MTRLKKFKSKLCIILSLICAFCCTVTLFAACSSTSQKVTDPNYTYTETEKSDNLIANATFSLNVTNNKLDSFPSTPSNWTKSTENSSKSTVDSGVVNVSADGWKALLNKLYDDTDFVDYVIEYNETAIKAQIKQDQNKDNPSDSEIKKYLDEKAPADYFKNPSVRDGATDDFVYMLNNYYEKGYYGKGAAQKLTSSSSISIKAGKTYKISVWVYTNGLKNNGQTESATLVGNGIDSDGVNIRLTNSFNGNSQAEYRINNIDTQNVWKQYSIYVVGDKNYDSTATLVLGLGYGENTAVTEGTVFFDDITCEEVTTDVSGFSAKEMVFGSEDKIVVDASNATEFFYNMSIKNSTSVNSLNFPDQADNYYFTASNASNGTENITSVTKFGSEISKATVTGKGTDTLNVNLEKASYTVKIDGSFSVAPTKFNYITFYITNKLSKFGSTDITVNVIETTNGAKSVYPAIATYSNVSEDAVLAELLIKNNFPATAPYADRTFYLEIVIGPSKVNEVNIASDFASGEVIISNVTSYSNFLNAEDYTEKEDAPEYILYNKHISSVSDAKVALYKADYDADYTENDETESYNLNVAPGNVGEIAFKPTVVKGYDGITTKHIYLQDGENLSTAINDRTNITGTNSFAGLINTKYLTTYNTQALTDALNGAYDEDIQPIVIYNSTAEHYGFVGGSKTISASAYAKISAKVRVVGDATAYIYLVDTADKTKSVISFPAVGENVAQELSIKITKDTKHTDGWANVEFYVATGATAKDFRVEIWNGGRDGEDATKSQGFVFVKEITVSTASGFSEPSSAANAFSTSGNPLYTKKNTFSSLVEYTRALTDTEKQFNKEHSDKAVSYVSNYVWAKNDNMVYAIYNTLDPVEVDPYDSLDDETDTTEEETETNPATFWLSFSSILLAVILALAIIALIVKNVMRRRKANKSDAKSHYKVKSRIEISKENKKRIAKMNKATESVEDDEVEETSEPIEEIEQAEENAESTEEAVEPAEQDLDAYVYGDVQDFGDAVTNEEKSEENNDAE